ncbi:MAG TPA: RNA 2',3'-cyclic phosphodiesterase [Thermoplasmata archaeon]|nr:RNA 2',3'-cyclic phosphodiesterase [Thermoplasmata archaeon]
MVRAFLAVDVPLPGLAPRPGRPDAPTHATLAFLEDLPLARVAELGAGLEGSLRDIPPFAVSARGVGAFPSNARPRVVWAAIQEGAVPLQLVADRVREVLDRLGVRYDRRPFVPHVTFLRVRSPASARWAAALLAHPPEGPLGERLVDRVELKESELGPGGPTHRVLVSVRLAGPAEGSSSGRA